MRAEPKNVLPDACTERKTNPGAQAALKKEWDHLRSYDTKGCSGEEFPRERSHMESEHRARSTTALFGSAFDMCVETDDLFRWACLGARLRAGRSTRATKSTTRTAAGRFSRGRPVPPPWHLPRSPASTPPFLRDTFRGSRRPSCRPPQKKGGQSSIAREHCSRVTRGVPSRAVRRAARAPLGRCSAALL